MYISAACSVQSISLLGIQVMHILILSQQDTVSTLITHTSRGSSPRVTHFESEFRYWLLWQVIGIFFGNRGLQSPGIRRLSHWCIGTNVSDELTTSIFWEPNPFVLPRRQTWQAPPKRWHCIPTYTASRPRTLKYSSQLWERRLSQIFNHLLRPFIVL
jgi:hypothetical protein